MVKHMTMKKVNINEAKAHLSEYLKALQAGERVVICNRNRPVAELVNAGGSRTEPRLIGGAKGRLTVPETFFDPLPDEFVDGFYPAAPSSDPRPLQVAQRGATYVAPRPAPASRRRARRTRR
jgi:prevent-host-death family protein